MQGWVISELVFYSNTALASMLGTDAVDFIHRKQA